MTLRECAAGAGLEVLLEVRGSTFVWELHRHDDRPGAMLDRVAARARVVPLKSFIDVYRATDVVPRWTAVAPEDVDKSRSHATDVDWLRHLSRRRNRLAIRREGLGMEHDVRRGCHLRVDCG
jgi:hypothetical protein